MDEAMVKDVKLMDVGDKLTKADKIVKDYSLWAIGAGIIPLPIVDVVTLSGVQLKMIYDLSKEYDVDFSADIGKKIILSLIGSIIPKSVATGFFGSMLKVIPVIGGIVGALSMPAVAAGTTFAIGKVFIQHYESGGTLLDMDPKKHEAYYKAQFEAHAIKMKDKK